MKKSNRFKPQNPELIVITAQKRLQNVARTSSTKDSHRGPMSLLVSATMAGKIFAPSKGLCEDLAMGLLEKQAEAANAARTIHSASPEIDAEMLYIQRYRNELQESQVKNPTAWEELIQAGELLIVCERQHGPLTNRFIFRESLAQYCAEKGVTFIYEGEHLPKGCSLQTPSAEKAKLKRLLSSVKAG